MQGGGSTGEVPAASWGAQRWPGCGVVGLLVPELWRWLLCLVLVPTH